MSFRKLRKPQGFQPTPAMLLYAQSKAKLGKGVTQAEIARSIHISAEQVSVWKQKPGFEEWLEDAVSMYRSPIHDMLHGVAVNRAHFDFNFWKELAIKFDYIQRDDGKKFEKESIPNKEQLAQLLIDAAVEMRKMKSES